MIKKKEWLAQQNKFDELKGADWKKEDLEKPLIRGLTPLMWACRTGNKTMLIWLVNEKSVDLQGKDASEWTAIMHAIGSEQEDIINWLLKKESFDENKIKQWEKVMLFHDVNERIREIIKEWVRAHRECGILKEAIKDKKNLEDSEEQGESEKEGERGKVKRL